MILFIVRLPAWVISFLSEHFEWLLLLAAALVFLAVLATLPYMPR